MENTAEVTKVITSSCENFLGHFRMFQSEITDTATFKKFQTFREKLQFSKFWWNFEKFFKVQQKSNNFLTKKQFKLISKTNFRHKKHWNFSRFSQKLWNKNGALRKFKFCRVIGEVIFSNFGLIWSQFGENSIFSRLTKLYPGNFVEFQEVFEKSRKLVRIKWKVDS